MSIRPIAQLLGMVLPLLLLGGCSRDNERRPITDEVHMSFNFQTTDQQSKSLRAQGDAPSVNQDAVDQEDYIKRLAFFIFQPGDGGNKVLDYFTTDTYFILSFQPGVYDFYIVANYPAGDETNLKLMTKSQLELYLAKPQSFTTRVSPNNGGGTDFCLPMARIYRNQNIPHGGTPYNPIAYRPTIAGSEQLAPVSRFGKDAHSGVQQQNINLVRACAKISFRLNGKGIHDIAKVEYINPVMEYTFMQTPLNKYASLHLPSPQLPAITWLKDGGPLRDGTLTPCIPKTWETATATLYVPERLFAPGETVGWLRDRALNKDEAIGPVQYLQITLTDKRIYKIPIISNGEEKAAKQSYLEFIRQGNGSKKPDFSIVRNMHYHIEAQVDKDVYVGVAVADYKTELLDEIIIYPYGVETPPNP